MTADRGERPHPPLALQFLFPLVEFPCEEHRLEEAKEVFFRDVGFELFVHVALLIQNGEVGNLGLEHRLNRHDGTPLRFLGRAGAGEGVR